MQVLREQGLVHAHIVEAGELQENIWFKVQMKVLRHLPHCSPIIRFRPEFEVALRRKSTPRVDGSFPPYVDVHLGSHRVHILSAFFTKPAWGQSVDYGVQVSSLRSLDVAERGPGCHLRYRDMRPA